MSTNGQNKTKNQWHDVDNNYIYDDFDDDDDDNKWWYTAQLPKECSTSY